MNFIEEIIEADLASGKHKSIATRFPPEPNGYLHIGHAKSICLNFGLAQKFAARCETKCNLRFDDTNPLKEDVEYIDSIQEDVSWLGFKWAGLYYASDYYDKIYECAEQLVRMGKAYVCDLSADEIRESRGTLTAPGRESPFRGRAVEENLDLFRRMRAGGFADGAHTLRAKIDMASPNLNMRDPVLYRIRHATHPHVGDKWCIYPMYDYAHPLSDMIEGITHSICTLEFEDHRPFYDWVLHTLDTPCKPRQIEFSRLNLDYTVMSKRLLLELVRDGHVRGWDDPRMPTIQGLRRRGVTPAALRDFSERVGVTKKDNSIEMGLLENCIREDLDRSARRTLAVLRPLKVVIENYPDGQAEEFDAPYHPTDQSMGSRKLPFSRELYIEQDDFMENPPKQFFRLAEGREVRLKYAYFIKCINVIKDASGRVTELRCTYDPATRGGNAPDGRKVKGTIHWVSVRHALRAEVRLYDRLFTDPAPASHKDRDFKEFMNPASLEAVPEALVEPSLAGAKPEDRVQFERLGFFCADRHDFAPGRLVFNRTVTLRDTWAKIKPGL